MKKLMIKMKIVAYRMGYHVAEAFFYLEIFLSARMAIFPL